MFMMIGLASEPSFNRQCLPRIFHGHQPTFTHGDFQRRNIIVQRAENKAGVEAPK
jgi:hypothetical protein